MNALRRGNVLWVCQFYNRPLTQTSIDRVILQEMAIEHRVSITIADQLHGLVNMLNIGYDDSLSSDDNALINRYREANPTLHPKALPFYSYPLRGSECLYAFRTEWLEQLRPVLEWQDRAERTLQLCWWMHSSQMCKAAWQHYLGQVRMLLEVMDTIPEGEEWSLTGTPTNITVEGRQTIGLVGDRIQSLLQDSNIKNVFKFVVQEDLPVVKPYSSLASGVIDMWKGVHPLKEKFARKVMTKYAN